MQDVQPIAVVPILQLSHIVAVVVPSPQVVQLLDALVPSSQTMHAGALLPSSHDSQAPAVLPPFPQLVQATPEASWEPSEQVVQ